MRKFAAQGLIMIEMPHLLKHLDDKAAIRNSRQVVERGEKLGILQITHRQFGGSYRTISYVSLKLEIMSHESLMWILMSLKKDEMAPNEKAI
jgi:hypothetical protein